MMHPVPRELLRRPLEGGTETRPCALQLWDGVEEKLFEMMSEPGKMARRRDCEGSDDGQPRADDAEIRRQRMQMYAAEDRVKAHSEHSVSPDIPDAVAAGAKPSATKNAHRSWCRSVQARASVPPVRAHCPTNVSANGPCSMSRELVDASCAEVGIENKGFVVHESSANHSNSNWPLVEDTDQGDSASVVQDREVRGSWCLPTLTCALLRAHSRHLSILGSSLHLADMWIRVHDIDSAG